jgi:hypothetical protein
MNSSNSSTESSTNSQKRLSVSSSIRSSGDDLDADWSLFFQLGGGSKLVGLVRALPWKIEIGATEVPVRGRLSEDWLAQI